MLKTKKLKAKKRNRGFSVHPKLMSIKKAHRMKFLRSRLGEKQKNINFEEALERRRNFDENKLIWFPLTKNTKCYICDGLAIHRHHVLPIIKGGKNKLYNIVPLCITCHHNIHPHMKEGYKKPVPEVKVPVLGIPIKTIVVIPPVKSEQKLY